MKRIAFLTSGGDCPGMNACIRAIVKSSLYNKVLPFAIFNGYKGMIENDIHKFSYKDVNNIIQLGGTIIGSARSKEFIQPEFRKTAIENLKKHQIDGLIVIGGDGTFTGATVLAEEMSIPIIGIPGTIDNDIFGTDFSIGYDTALNTVIQAVDKIRDTANSHKRVFFVEVMGRDSGCIALNAAIASGAESVLIPENLTDINSLINQIKNQNKGNRSSIIIVAEGDDAGGAFEILQKVKPFLPDYDLRASVLGHIQRGGNPSAFDRILASEMGISSVDLLLNGKSNLMIASNGVNISHISILDGINNKKQSLLLEKGKLLEKMLTLN
jgi:6-phosphofructokinase 1